MTTALLVVVVLFLHVSCTPAEIEQVTVEINTSEIPRLHALHVTTVISDSGITRYRINTPQWDIFDKSNDPYWEFPIGVHFERFDEDLNVDANIHCQYAKYLENDQLWELKGNVRATNIQGELFETEHLFWNQRSEKIYSESTIKITQENYIIQGVGFESNQEMTKYQVTNTTGIIPVEE